MLAAVLVLPDPSLASERIRLSLEEAVRMALRNNPALRVERYGPLTASQEVVKEKGAFDPILSLTMSGSREEVPASSVVMSSEERSLDMELGLEGRLVTGTEYSLNWTYERYHGDSSFLTLNPYHLTTLTLTVSQPLLKGFGEDIQTTMIDVAEENLRASEFGLRMKAEEIVDSAVSSYYDVLLSEERRRTAGLSLELAREVLEEVEARIETGAMAPVEIYKAEAEVAKREEALLEAENALRDGLDLLKAVLGMEDLDTEVELTEPEPPLEGPPDLKESIASALSHRRDLLQARSEKRRLELLERYYRNQMLPDLELFGTVGLNGLSGTPSGSLDSLLEGRYRSWRIGLSLQIPLWRRASKAEYLKAGYGVRRAEARLKELQQEVRLEVRRAWRELALWLKRIEAARKTRTATEKRLEAEEERFRIGMATLNDVLRFQQEYTDALFEERRARIEYLKALSRFDKAKGTILERYTAER